MRRMREDVRQVSLRRRNAAPARCSRTLLPYVLPQVRGRNRERNRVAKLEAELDGQLNAARTSAAQERVADAYVASGDDVIGTVADFAALGGRSKPARAAWRRNGIGRRVGDKCRQHRIGEVGMVQDIEEVGA